MGKIQQELANHIVAVNKNGKTKNDNIEKTVGNESL